MITKEHKEQLIEIFEKYSELRQNLSDLERLTTMLKEQQEIVHQQLTDNRNKEKELINKIEEEIGTKLTQNDLLKIVKKDEN